MKNNFLSRIYGQVLVALSLSLLLSGVLSAQVNEEEVDYLQAILGMEKKEAIAEFLQLKEDAPFWAIYDAYEAERKELGKTRLDLLEKYANNYFDMGDVVTDDLIKRMQTQKKSLDKLIDQYYKKIKKASGSKVAAQFYQFENYILSAIRIEILENIPFIGELD